MKLLYEILIRLSFMFIIIQYFVIFMLTAVGFINKRKDFFIYLIPFFYLYFVFDILYSIFKSFIINLKNLK
jgi:hypothetical protein